MPWHLALDRRFGGALRLVVKLATAFIVARSMKTQGVDLVTRIPTRLAELSAQIVLPVELLRRT